MNNSLKKILDSKKFPISFVTGVNEKGKEVYAYIFNQKSSRPDYQEHVDGKIPINLNKDGYVIASGEGFEPDEETKKLVEDTAKLFEEKYC